MSVVFQSATPATPPAGTDVETDTNGAGKALQVVTIGIPGSASRIPTDATNGLGVDIKRASGQAAAAAAAPAVFYVVAGYDGAAVRSLKTDTAGVLQVANASPLPAGTNTLGKVDQGAGGASAWKVDGSAVTQPVSGTVTANIGTTPGLTDTQLRASSVPVDTELPAAAALADAAANPTSPGVGSFGMLWNGATWDRAPGTAAAGMKVAANADNVTSGSFTANGQTLVAPVAAGMAGFSVAQFGTYATGATVQFEASYDGGTTYISTIMANSSVVTAVAFAISSATVANASASFIGPIPPGATHLRLRVSAWAAPTGTMSVRLSQSVAPQTVPATLGSVSITGAQGGGSSAFTKAEDAASTSGDLGIFVVAVRNDTQAATTSADGDYIQFSTDARGALRVNPASFAYSHISTATTTTVKSGAGELHSISVNTKGTVASTITVFDNTAGSGTVIGVIDSLNLSGAFVLDVAFATGLTIVTTGTVAPDITVSFR